MSVANNQVTGAVLDPNRLVKNDFKEEVYSTLSEALEGIRERKDDAELAERALIFSGSRGIPNVLKEQEKIPAVFFRQVATPNYEMRRFMALADLGNLVPIVFEYAADKFVTSNPEKYSLAKLSFFSGRGKKGGAKIMRTKVVDMQCFNGKAISDVRTLWGQSLIDFHHELLTEAYGVRSPLLFDGSDWFRTNGASAHTYYEAFLSLFAKDAILFDDFLIDGTEHDFTKDVFLPAFRKIREALGVKPLIVGIDPADTEWDEYWRCYSTEVVPWVNERMYNSQYGFVA